MGKEEIIRTYITPRIHIIYEGQNRYHPLGCCNSNFCQRLYAYIDINVNRHYMVPDKRHKRP